MSRRARRDAHRKALDDLQDAVDRTMEPGDTVSQREDLRRAAGREKATRTKVSDERRKARR